MKVMNLAVALLLCIPQTTGAYYTYENFFSIPHEQPAFFEADGAGGFRGETTGGHVFTQRPVLNNVGVRLHKFSIGTAYFYISDRGVIAAKNDTIALSIYFGRS